MATRHFLYLTNDRLLGLIWRNGKITERNSFDISESESELFRKYLVSHRSLSAYLFVDLIEEDFRLETMPHLRGSDAQAVQSRKLAQIYRNTTFRHAIVQGRETEGRRDSRVLYHAITNPELLKPWLDALERSKIPLEGIYSSPITSGRLVNELELSSNNTLLVALVPDCGLRQTYFQNKQMKFSRLTPLATDGVESMAKQIATETSRTWQYLESLRFFTAEDRLEVCILAHTSDKPLIADEMLSFPFLRYRFLDVAEVANTIKLKEAPAGSRAEEIFIHSFAKGKLENHYASPENQRFANYLRARTALYAATAIALLLGAAGATYFLLQASKISADIDRRAATASQKQNEFQALSNAVRVQSLNSDAVRDTAAFYINHMRPLPSPVGLLKSLSQVFAEFPEISLSQVVWETGMDPAATPTYTRETSKSTSTMRSEIKPDLNAQVGTIVQRIVAKNPNDPNPQYPGNDVQVAIIGGAITPFDGNYRKALARVNALVSRLNKLQHVSATALSMPLDTGVNTLITAGADVEKSDRTEAAFVLRVQLAASAELPGAEGANQ